MIHRSSRCWRPLLRIGGNPSREQRLLGLARPSQHHDIRLGIRRTITESTKNSHNGVSVVAGVADRSQGVGTSESHSQTEDMVMLAQRNAIGNAVLALRAERSAGRVGWRDILSKSQLRRLTSGVDASKKGMYDNGKSLEKSAELTLHFLQIASA